MSDAAIQPLGKQRFRQAEFYLFTIIAFVGKSLLLVQLPYRPWYVNTFYTVLLLVFLYGYFRFRQGIRLPPFIIFCLAAAVATDVLGNLFQLYGDQPWIGPIYFDEFSHFVGSGFSLVPAFWLLRATTKRMGLKLPLDTSAFFAVTITFSLCAYYEILELWDEKFFTAPNWRLHSPQDSPNDLQWDLAGIVTAALITTLIFKLTDLRRTADEPAS
jgi:hypothetical protein